MTILRLKKNEDRRLRAGHVWIYSNEVDVAKTPLSNFSSGEIVTLENSVGKALGVAYVNPQCLLCARLVSRNPHQLIDETFLYHQLQKALAWREVIFDRPYYRLVFGESDGLPGLVIDRFEDVLSVQLNTAGMQALQVPLLEALKKLLSPRAILLRNDSSIRVMEGLPLEVKPLYGDPPQEITLEENKVCFIAPLWEGQKTGWFYDHRENRARLANYVKGKRVLDVFSYLGGWGIQMAVMGACEVTCIETSEFALSFLKKNAALNRVSDHVHAIAGDAFEQMNTLRKKGEKFDVVVLDPPAFIKKRKDIEEGKKAYHRLNELGMQLLSAEGLLVSASCSFHLSREDLVDIIRAAGVRVEREVQVIAEGHQGPDHPVHPAIPETDYLKCFMMRVI